MNYRVNKASLSYHVQNKTILGSDEVLLNKAIDLTGKFNWAEKGFTIEPFYGEDKYISFRKETEQFILSLWKKAGLTIDKDFPLEKYHQLAIDQEVHLAAVEQTKLISTEYFPLGIHQLEERISEICKEQLHVRNPFDNQSVFHFRVIRPHSKDNNPLHRDVWLEDYSDCINLYIPIAGSNIDSSLIIAPGSHRWPESKIERTLSGAEINEIKFNVPAVAKIDGEVEFIRPDPGLNEVLVFSPYLIHGGASNLNNEFTRISIEIRLWKKS